MLRQTGLLEARAIMTGVQLHDPAKHLRDIEHRNAVPWEALFAVLDKAGAPRAKQRMLRQPGASGKKSQLAAVAASPASRHSLSRSLPMVPIAGTIDQPVSQLGRTLH